MAETKVVNLEVQTNFDSATKGIDKLKTGLKETTTESKNLSESMSGGKPSEFINKIGDGVGKLNPAFGGAISGAKGLLSSFVALIANPVGIVIAGIVIAVSALVAIFKTFQPLVDKIEQGMAALGAVMDVVKNTFIAVFTGTKSLGDAIGGLGNDMSTAAKKTVELVKAQQDLEDALASQEVQTAKNRAEINKLNVQAKNRSLTEEERLKLLNKASELEEKDYKQRLKNSNELLRQAQEAIIIKAGFNKQEAKLLKEQGLAAKELAESKGGNYDEEFKKLSDALKGRISLEDESTSNLEKNQNKRDALEDAQKAKRDKIEEDRKARIKKQQDDANAAREKRLKEINEDFDLEVTNLQKGKDADLEALKIISEAKKANREALMTEEEIAVEAENKRYKDKLFQATKGLTNDAEIKAATLVLEIQHADKLNNIWKISNDKKVATEKTTSEANKAIAKAEAKAKIEQMGAVSNALEGLSKIAGEQTVAGKTLAIASATINTYKGISEVWAAATMGNPVVDMAVKIASSAIVATQGIANVSKIMAVQVPGGGGGGGSAPTATAPPQFNVIGASGTNQIAQTMSNREMPPIKAYVVGGDVTTQQGMNRKIIQNASMG